MTRYQAKIQLPQNAIAPDEYDQSNGRIPADDFVVSRDKNGSTLSVYGDLRWTLTPYAPDGRTTTLCFDFWDKGEITAQRDHLARELRWLMFLLIYRRSGHALGNGSLRNYIKFLQDLARFCESRALQVQEVLAYPPWAIESLGKNRYLAGILASLANTLHELGPDVVGFEVMSKASIRDVNRYYHDWAEESKQHPPIPTRLYSIILSSLNAELEEFNSIADRIIALVEQCTSDPLMGRSISSQWKIRNKRGMGIETGRPDFAYLLRMHNLENYWSSKGYKKSICGLSTALTEAMITASLQIQAFTGMRANEVESLPYHCLDEVKRNDDGSVHYIVNGRVTKFSHGKIKRVQWVTSESGKMAILIAQRIANAIYSTRGEIPRKSTQRINSHFLFISPRFFTHKGKNTPAFLNLSVCKGLRSRLQPAIRDEDLSELEQIDLHRAWRTEKAFQAGQPWKLTSHQLRRSLALYAQRSGLVSLPSLKRQLHHITNEMSMYYSRGSAFANNFINDRKEHFGYEWQETQPVSQFLSYAAHVLLTDEPLFGVHHHWISHRLRDDNGIVVVDRETTLKRFQKGEMAYRDTILGGCVKIGECDKNPLDYLHVECLTTHCNNLVGSKKKLERVIAVQGNWVDKLYQAAPNSPDHHHEMNNLTVLKATLAKIQIAKK